MPECVNNSFKWAVAAVATSLTACSIHPIPDDVSRYSTPEIVRNIRCEAKDAVRDRITAALHKRGIYDVAPDEVLRDTASFARVQRRDPTLAAKFKGYGASAITYDFEFNITEQNDNSGTGTFEMPFTGGGMFSLVLDGQFDKKRQAIRKFTSVETFADLAILPCGGWVQSERNPVHPLTGSIGVGRIINTFINISEMGSQELALAKIPDDEKAFKDVIEFTTEISGSINPTLKMTPIPDRFLPTDISITHGSTRKDIHRVTITILFPDLEPVRKAVGARARLNLAAFTIQRALENNCVATERAREDQFGMLRRTPPAIYCRPSGGYARFLYPFVDGR